MNKLIKRLIEAAEEEHYHAVMQDFYHEEILREAAAALGAQINDIKRLKKFEAENVLLREERKRMMEHKQINEQIQRAFECGELTLDSEGFLRAYTGD